MVDYSKQFYALLCEAVGEAAEVGYELFMERENLPFVSYYEIGNVATADGDTIRHSRVIYNVKICGTEYAVLQSLASSIDDKLKAAGFRRTATNELKDEFSLIKVLTFEGHGFEEETTT